LLLNYNLASKPRPESIINSYKRSALIYNPRAGRILRSGQSLIRRTEEALRNAGHNLSPAPTTGPGTAAAIAREQVDRGADLVIVAGGDGTINETLEGIAGTGVPLAILPAGTANVLATEMKIGRDPVKAAAHLHEWKPYRVSAGELIQEGRRRIFLLLTGIGLDAHIVHHVSNGLKARTGKFAYWVAGWSLLGRGLPQFEVEVDGVSHTCSFALISKVRNYGGDFEIARKVHLLDDTFEVVLFQGKTTLNFVPYFVGMACGRMEGMRGITVLRARKVKACCAAGARVLVQVDGEPAGELPAEVRIVPDALALLVPDSYAVKVPGRLVEPGAAIRR